jgi:hypothetical protein
MNHYLGIWMDSQSAVIVRLGSEDDEAVVTHLSASAESAHPSTGRKKSGRAFWHRPFFSKRRMLARHENEVKEFFKSIEHEIGKAPRLFIFGPGEAKFEFKNLLVKNNYPADHIDLVEASQSNLSETQIVIKVKEHFGRNAPRIDLNEVR